MEMARTLVPGSGMPSSRSLPLASSSGPIDGNDKVSGSPDPPSCRQPDSMISNLVEVLGSA
jgi:hypothetical protein